MHQVLLVTSGIEHPTYACRKALTQIMMEIKGIRFDHIKSLEMLPDNLVEIDALVLYFHEDTLSDRALTLFDQYVYQGGGVLAVHSATASFMDRPHYFEILGGRFLQHGPISEFTIKPVNGSAVFSGIPPFIIEDELYVHTFQPDITPHFTAVHGTEEIPVIWTHRYGEGRVCYAMPGHRIETMQHPDYQNLLQQGLSWTLDN